MAEDNIVQRIKRWKPMSKRPIGRPKTHWEDDILENIKNMNACNWKKVKKRIEIVGRKWLSKPKTDIGCSAL
jgi:3-deoxy-D-arabino-heptulosonate 7-phosphate (DAHP) synthase